MAPGAGGETNCVSSGLFWNDHGKEFADLVPNLGDDVKRLLVGRGSATGDFNNDGRIDLLAVDFEGPVMLLENRTENASSTGMGYLVRRSRDAFASLV